MLKPILVSGIQPTGRLHIGNYLGMIKQAVELQNSDKYQCFYPIVDLHSLTEDFEPSEKWRQIIELAADMIAAGLDPKKSIISLQSQICAHSELTWILNAITPMGEMQRMTQYKDKSEHAPQNMNVGLFDYPVLMAADIILYDARFVPVGEDQLQHLELTRTLARKFNARFGKTFVEPQPILAKMSRVMSLDDPLKKMSKSHPGGCIFIDDSPENIKAKLKKAVTDSGNEVKHEPKLKPAISNLLGIYSTLSAEPVAKIEKQFAGRGYGDFKMKLAEVIVNHFADFRARKKKLLAKPDQLALILKIGSAAAAKIAAKKMAQVKQKIGILLI